MYVCMYVYIYMYNMYVPYIYIHYDYNSIYINTYTYVHIIIWYIPIGPIVIPWEKDASRATTHEGLEEFGKE